MFRMHNSHTHTHRVVHLSLLTAVQILHVLMAAPLVKEVKPVFRSCVHDVVRSFRFDINSKTDKGLTAAHHGAKRARRWNLKVLLMCNPDLSITDQYDALSPEFARLLFVYLSYAH